MIKAPADSTFGENLSWFIDGCFLPVSSRGGRGKRALWGLFYEGTDPIPVGSALRN